MKQPEPINPYYPVFLNIRDKKCLVVGGGKVASRKVQTLIKHGAKVEVVSPTLCPELSQLEQNGLILVKQRGYKTTDLHDALIVIAATDDAKLNTSIAAEARRRGILVNVVDNLQASDFTVPSYFVRGDILVAVSTSGKSPALARKIKNELERFFNPEYPRLAMIADEVRSELKQQGITIDSNSWQEVLSLDSLIELSRQDKRQEAKELMLKTLKAKRGRAHD